MIEGIVESTRGSTSVAILSLALITVLAWTIHRIYFHPLSRVPGPLLRRLTSLPLIYTAYQGTEATCAARLHRLYGPVVLIGPNDVDIADSDAIQPIYVDKGGLLKVENYRNYDIDGHQSIFSTLDPIYRSKRAKAVMPMFAGTRIKQGCMNGGSIERCVDDFVADLQRARTSGRGFLDLLEPSRKLATNVVTGYLFGSTYTAFAEAHAATERKEEGQSANPFVEAFVAVGRLYLLTPWFFDIVLSGLARFAPDVEAIRSEDLVTDFVAQLVADCDAVDDADSQRDTYQQRLLDAGISPSETIAQCKDLIFAGTDSTSTTLATTLWHLARQPATLACLADELAADGDTPYLHATVREGLRVAMANPPRLPRRVAQTGSWTFKGHVLPPGTTVGCSSYILHFDPATFPDPLAFRPERWLNEEEGSGNGRTKDALERQRAAWFAFGAGSRQCIARTLATEELTLAIKKVVESQVLEGARVVEDKIALVGWFNSKIVGGKVEIAFSDAS